ncbi:MAG: hypothetical protein ACI3U2_08070 [Anaerovibrio sp.]
MRQVMLAFNDDGTLASSRLDGYPGYLGRKIDGRLLADDLLSVLLSMMNSKDNSYAGINYKVLIEPHIEIALDLLREE